MTEFSISKHAQTRYAERIYQKDNAVDITRFVKDNETKIKTEINKLISYGTLIFSGKQASTTGKGNIVDVYLKDTWIVLADSKANNVVTIFKIDLGCGDDFNVLYIEKMLEKIKKCQNCVDAAELQALEESDTYKELINDAKCQINEYRTMIHNLEEMCLGYQKIIDNNNVIVTEQKRFLADAVNDFIGKKEF